MKKVTQKRRVGRTLPLATAIGMICVFSCAASVSERADNAYNGTGSETETTLAANQTASPPANQTATAGAMPETPAPVMLADNRDNKAYGTQPKPKAAVYIMGNPAGRDALRMAVNTFLVKSGKYQMVAVDAIDIVAKEHTRQMSGSVSDAQIAKLGYDAGAQYVCVVERTELDGFSYVATRMVSVESKVAEFADMVKLPHGGDIIEFIQWQIGSMLGMAVGPRPISAPTVAAPASSAPAPQIAAVTTKTTNSGSSLTDTRDGKTYRTVVIGGKKWMAENINYQTGNSQCYRDDDSYCDRYGRMYNWETSKNACPSGWHLPSTLEWIDLVRVAGGDEMDKKLRSTSGWNGNGNGTDVYGFSALPGGWRYADGTFSDVGDGGYWWTATEHDASKAYTRDMKGNAVIEFKSNKNGLGSVRCVQDN